MYLRYFQIRLVSFYRGIAGGGVLRLSLVLLLLFGLSTAYIKGAKEYISPAVFCFLLYAVHTGRKDRHFIKVFWGRKSVFLYGSEYFLLSIPFLAVSLCKGYYADLVLIVSSILLSPVLFRFKIKGIQLSCPFFRKGSYEYQSAFRTNFIFLALCYFMAFIGMYKGNANLLYVFYVLSGLLYIIPLFKKEPVIYTVNFIRVKDLLAVKFVNVIYNTLLLLLPLLLICPLMDTDMFITLLFLSIPVILFACASVLLNYCFHTDLIIILVFVIVLVPTLIVSVMHPPLSVLFALLLFRLLVRVNNRLSRLLEYDKDRKAR
ncbi:hypothetical protein Barb6_03081 [Bacteroidales bacterium Barb6]|nr:hypothetical protein Barb6_03081 [Bacteroidales bacterium Barb6]